MNKIITVRELIAANLEKSISKLSQEDIEKGLDMKIYANTNFEESISSKEHKKLYTEYANNGEVIVGLYEQT